jgi:PAS domain S-box-containing protein
MKTSSRELKRVHYLIVFWLFLLHFIPGMVAGEETPVPNTFTLLKSRLKTVIVTDYYPYTFVNKEGVPDGFSVNLANAVAKVMGMDLEIKVDTWERAMLRLETGEIDFLPMMAYSKERDKVFDFSVPHTIAFDAFFTRKDSKIINSTEGLKGQTVIVMKGDQAHDYLLSSSFVDSEHLILIDSLPEALRLLSSKKGDAALMPRLVGLTLMNDLNLTNLTQSPVVVESYNRPFSFAVKDGDLLLLERLNQGLSIVKKTGQYREIYDKWFGALEPKELSLKSVLKYIAGLLLAFLLIGSVFAMWTFSMRKQVVSRTKELADEIIERKNAEMRFRQVVDTIQEVFWIGSLDWKEIYYVSPAYEHIWGGKCDEIYQNPLAWVESVVKEDRPKIRAAIPKVIHADTLKIVFPDYRIRKPDGSIAWISVRTFPILDVSGRPYRIAGIAEDITTRKQAEKSLQDILSHQEALLAAIPDIIMEVDANKVYTWANQVGLEFFGEDVLGKEAAYYFEGDHDTYQAVGALFRGEEDVIYVRSWQRRRDGQKRLLAWLCRVLKDSAGNVIGAISTARDITERNLIEEYIEREKVFYDHIINSLPGIFYMYDDQWKLVRWNRKHEEVTGYSHEELFGMHILDLFAEAHKHHITLCVQSVFAEGESFAEAPLLTKSGKQIPHFLTGRLTELDGKQYLLGVGVDITERVRAEEEKDLLQAQLLQAQKMESVGRLASGVAHDFNNMLTAIIGHAELAMMKCTPSAPIIAHLEVIEDTAHRSADLTRQLLTFARKQTIAPKALDINGAVSGMLKMLQRLIGEDLDLVWTPGANLWQVKIDPSQIDQLLVNLCVNARDAITGVGKINIETKNIAIDEAYCAFYPSFVCGEYVMLAVSDNGHGMSKEVLDHIFEPFFTTKEVGKGTGLGLATVYGIVKQNNGFVNVYSESGKGATFKIYLPRFVGKAMKPTVESAVEMPRGSGETVLLVEDEAPILDVSKEILEQLGYVVLIASTPGEALRLAKTHAAKIHLLITDVVMPVMNGRDLSKLISNIKPGVKCLFISGYTANVIAHQGVLDEGVNFIQKPFSMKDLAFKVREVLDNADVSVVFNFYERE